MLDRTLMLWVISIVVGSIYCNTHKTTTLLWMCSSVVHVTQNVMTALFDVSFKKMIYYLAVLTMQLLSEVMVRE